VVTTAPPYGQPSPNIYRGLPFYSPAVLAQGGAVVTTSFSYPPLQLLLAALPQRLLGDYRYLQAAAVTGSAALLLLARPGVNARLAAGLLLTAPSLVLVVEQGWTEPMVVLFLSLTLFSAARARRLLPLALAGLFAIKQYTLALAPLVFLLEQERKAGLVLLLRSLGLAALTVLPFALWNGPGLWNDLVRFQVLQPFRADSFAFPALLLARGLPVTPQWLAFALLFLSVGLVTLRGPKGPSGFAAGTALGFVLFFGFSKQAFYNYWYFALAALCWALALSDGPAPEASAITGPDGALTPSSSAR
jgi:hypothetical protein